MVDQTEKANKAGAQNENANAQNANQDEDIEARDVAQAVVDEESESSQNE